LFPTELETVSGLALQVQETLGRDLFVVRDARADQIKIRRSASCAR
jgi:hypothetical protein